MNREKLEFYLTDIETPVGKVISVTIALLVLVSSGIFVAETYDLSQEARWQLRGLDDCILMIFAGEYLLRLWSTK
ncbi:MAG: Ion transporter, partial [Anabaena sp. MDT14b]